MTDLEQTLMDAFRLAENSRKAAGYAARKASDMQIKRRDGTKWTGPSRYKVTLWLRPWHYADAMHAKALSAKWITRSLSAFLESKLEETLPRVATRPPPKAVPDNVVPLRRRRKVIEVATAVARAPERLRAQR